MADARALQAHFSDPSTLARFIANPRAVALELGVDTEDASQVKELERLAQTSQTVLSGIASGAGINTRQADWGIGAGCCSTSEAQFLRPAQR